MQLCLATANQYKIKIMVEMGDRREKASRSQVVCSTRHRRSRAHNQDHDEGRASEGTTPGKRTPRANSSEDVHTADTSSISNAAMRGIANGHDDEQGRVEVTRCKTSSDDCNLVRGTMRARGDEELREETRKPKLKCLNLCNVDVQNMESKLIENDPTSVVTTSKHPGETRQALKTCQHERMR